MVCAFCVAYLQEVNLKSVHLIYFINNFYFNYPITTTFSIIWALIVILFTTNELSWICLDLRGWKKKKGVVKSYNKLVLRKRIIHIDSKFGSCSYYSL